MDFAYPFKSSEKGENSTLPLQVISAVARTKAKPGIREGGTAANHLENVHLPGLLFQFLYHDGY